MTEKPSWVGKPALALIHLNSPFLSAPPPAEIAENGGEFPVSVSPTGQRPDFTRLTQVKARTAAPAMYRHGSVVLPLHGAGMGGFVPMTTEEISEPRRKAETDCQPPTVRHCRNRRGAVGFGLAIPNFNQALKHINGRLNPFGLLKLLWYRRSIDEARMHALGVKSAYRHKGLDALIIMRVFTEATRMGIRQGECSAILEDNLAMRRGVGRIGAVADKTYRIYERTFRS